VGDGLDAMFGTEKMAAIFSSSARVEAMLRFEAALARAEARAGVIPNQAAEAIAEATRSGGFDAEALHREARTAGNLAIPVVAWLTEATSEDARGHVHWGATSQDAIDTGMMLQVRDGLDALDEDLIAAGMACEALATRHARTPMAGRTLLQQAVPITFGLKAARWLSLTTRGIRRIRGIRAGLPVQLGGAAGTLAALGADGIRVADLLAEELGIVAPELPWHAERDVVAEIAAAIAITAGAMGKIATDVILLAQTEVGEVTEGVVEGGGGSSTMPQKRNPVHAPAVIACARFAHAAASVIESGLAHEHERAAGAWHAEWRAVGDLFVSAAGAAARARAMLEGLDVHPDRMRINLDATRGQIMAEALMMALAPRLGRGEAHRLVGEVAARAAAGGDLLGAAAEDLRIREVLSEEDIGRVLDPASYLGASEAFVERAVGGFRALQAGRTVTA
jgi:3-carboxy-cis,cis-muconate cycloisomerase